MKNTGSLLTGYIRHKEYTWKETFYSTLGQTWKFEPHGTAHKGFNWKILRHQIHHYLGRPSIIKMPNSVFSTNVMFIVEN